MSERAARLRPGDVISYVQMHYAEGMMLQRGMNFRPGGKTSIVLMSVRPGAPYNDRVEEDGRVLIYEGHNIPRTRGGPDPESVDQLAATPSGRPTQNGLFHSAAQAFKRGKSPAEQVKVYEKVRSGIWVYNGLFLLKDAWTERSGGRRVFKFRLELAEEQTEIGASAQREVEHVRMIPAWVKQEVWKRDKGRCRMCGSTKNLHFDHIIPWSKGGSSLTPENIQLLCARCNIKKKDRIE